MTRVRLLVAVGLLASTSSGFCDEYEADTRVYNTAIQALADIYRERVSTTDRSPVDLVISADEKFAITANETSASISLVDLSPADLSAGHLVAELPCGSHPAAVVAHGETLLVSCSYSGTLERFRWQGRTLELVAKIALGFEPVGIAISPDGRMAYVALHMAAEVAVVDLETNQVVAKIPVGRWPRYVALSPDGARLAVNCNGDRAIAVVDTAQRAMLFFNEYGGINAGHMQVSADGQWVYVPWMIYRHNPIEERNVQRGWVLGSRIARAADGRASPARSDHP